jgi:hypothetical protein
MRHRVVNLIRAGVVTAADAARFIAANGVARGRPPRRRCAISRCSTGASTAGPPRCNTSGEAEALRHAGRLEDARREAEEARRIFQELGDRRERGDTACACSATWPAIGAPRRSAGGSCRAGSPCSKRSETTTGGAVRGGARRDRLPPGRSRASARIIASAGLSASRGRAIGSGTRSAWSCRSGSSRPAAGRPSHASWLLTARASSTSIGYRLGLAQCDITTRTRDHRDGHWDRAHARSRSRLGRASEISRTRAARRRASACSR